MKKIRITFLVIILVSLIVAVFFDANHTEVRAQGTEASSLSQVATGQVQTTLSNMSEEECIDLIVDYGIEIPQEFVDSPELGRFVKLVVETVESNPNYEFMYSYDVLQNFVRNIRDLVASQVMTRSVTHEQSIDGSTAYTLQDNTQYGPWNNNFSGYNCYIYSIGRTDVFKNPGYFSNKSFSINMSIYEMAMLVKSDLEALGKGGGLYFER